MSLLKPAPWASLERSIALLKLTRTKRRAKSIFESAMLGSRDALDGWPCSFTLRAWICSGPHSYLWSTEQRQRSSNSSTLQFAARSRSHQRILHLVAMALWGPPVAFSICPCPLSRGSQSRTRTGVAMLLALFFPRALKRTLATFRSLGAIPGKDSFVLWTLWPLERIGTAPGAIGFEPELRPGTRR